MMSAADHEAVTADRLANALRRELAFLETLGISPAEAVAIVRAASAQAHARIFGAKRSG